MDYTAILQPLQDLASNFDIDIAECLTDYLEELSELVSFLLHDVFKLIYEFSFPFSFFPLVQRVSIDGGSTNVNFVEAAIIIQKSSVVYSQKVEHLHKLCYQTLEYLANERANSKGDKEKLAKAQQTHLSTGTSGL